MRWSGTRLVMLGLALIVYGLIGAYGIATFAWGGLLIGPTRFLLAIPAAILLAGIGLVVGGSRCCRSRSSRLSH